MLQKLASFFDLGLRSQVGRRSRKPKRSLARVGSAEFCRSAHDRSTYQVPVFRQITAPKPREIAWRLYRENGIRYRL